VSHSLTGVFIATLCAPTGRPSLVHYLAGSTIVPPYSVTPAMIQCQM